MVDVSIDKEDAFMKNDSLVNFKGKARYVDV